MAFSKLICWYTSKSIKFFVIEIDDFCAIGSGSCEALGSLLSSANIDDPVERIKMAIKASAAHDIYVDYPIVISNTKDTEYKVYYEKDL